MGPAQLLLILIAAVLVFGPKSLSELGRGLAEGINNFRGGPPPPTHPLPGDDSALLCRRPRRRDPDNMAN